MLIHVRRCRALYFAFIALMLSLALPAQGNFFQQWPKTDFTKSSVNLEQVLFGGPGKDGIPAIDSPLFVPVKALKKHSISADDPVIGVIINGEAKAYPLSILIWHEIVNDEVGGVPVAVTYCPLCNTAIVFDRRLGSKVLDFGTTGNLRHSDLIMYDRQTQSWWQQYEGSAIVGDLVGAQLTTLASRLESFDNFKKRAPNGQVLIPNNPAFRDYGANPYVGYDSAALPFLYRGQLPQNLAPMTRVIAVDNTAISLPLLAQESLIKREGMVFSWRQGQRSALDARLIEKSRDIGNVIVSLDGVDVPYVVTFAFAYFAFNPDGSLLTKKGDVKLYPAAKN